MIYVCAGFCRCGAPMYPADAATVHVRYVCRTCGMETLKQRLMPQAWTEHETSSKAPRAEVKP